MSKPTIWVPHPTEAWVQAKVVSTEKNSVIVKSDKGAEMTLPGDISNYDVVIPGSVAHICDNLVDMEVFNEGVILHQIKERYNNGLIYTFVGNILIALNPYQKLNIYGEEIMGAINKTVRAGNPAKPHVFSIAAYAFTRMMNDGLDQSVLISGESGAGKTEATKKTLQFFSTVAGSTASRGGVSVENQILDSNPLLEAFGNAKTVRNNNSSRFGKYMEVNFDSRFAIKGCNVVSYLLEKTRVVVQMPSERNYHSFYMLLAGAPKDMKQEFSLKPAENFYYLNQSGCTEIQGRDDSQEFQELVSAMENLRLDEPTRRDMFRLVAAILHLGNLTFNPSRDTEGGSEVVSHSDLNRVASLLGVSNESLEANLCFKESTFGIGETITIPLDPAKACDQRDAYAKFIYGKLFDFIVYRVNNILFRGKMARNIGVLDIFGFEVFKSNSFEQLCINYCNERLQTFFNEIIFISEKAIYEEEEIDCTNITYQDNLGCVLLIDMKNTGILALLDEEVVVPRGSDTKFASRLHTTFDENAATKSNYYVRNRRKPNDFGVKHFAGEVMYTVDGFLEKNKDALSPSLVDISKDSKLALFGTIVKLGDDKLSASGAPPGAPTAGRKSGISKSDKVTLATKFKNDLDSLMSALLSTAPHFIRCVKTNDQQAPNRFDPILALRQLKYAGLFEAIHIRKAGYAIRMPMESFINRYKQCTRSAIRFKSKGATAAQISDLCKVMMIELSEKLNIVNVPNQPASYAIGLTKIFFRNLKIKHKLEECRNGSVDFVAVQLQRVARGFLGRKRLYAIQGEARRVKEQQRQKEKGEAALMYRCDGESRALEDFLRNDEAERKRLEEEKRERVRQEHERVRVKLYNAAAKLQKIYRGFVGRIKGKHIKSEVKLERSINARSEEGLKEAIALVDILQVKTKHVKTLKQNAKDLLLEVQGESYVKAQLNEAVNAASDEMLRTAIKLAEDAGMLYLEELRKARKALEKEQFRREVLVSIRSLLTKCITIPILLANTDKLDSYVLKATSLGLGGEYLVQDAVLRCQRIKSLIDIRNEIRYAVEVCSVLKMKSAMNKRQQLVWVYGNDLCNEEVTAVMNMTRMFALSTTKSDSSEDNDDEDEISDARLPPFVCEQLDRMRNAKTEEERRDATEKFILLVPLDTTRKEYLRMFKWVVSFASWKYSKSGSREGESEDGVSTGGDAKHKDSTLGSSLKASQTAGASPSKAKKTLSYGSTMFRNRDQKTKTDEGVAKEKKKQEEEEDIQERVVVIPFSQRQSKSAVAAHEALKKKRSKSTIMIQGLESKADRILQESVREYGKFFKKNNLDTGWQR